MSTIVDSPTFREHATAIVGEFCDLLAIPNITRDTQALEVNAAAIVELFAGTGVELRIERLDGAGPLIIGHLDIDPALPTVGIYIHADGQPVNEPDWKSDPFGPVLKFAIDAEPVAATADNLTNPDLRVYARASADDRAPLIALANALRHLPSTPTINLVLCIESEEEHGSPNLNAYLERFRDELAADFWWICDGPIHQSGRPQAICGVRGFVAVELTVYGPYRELHSGHYGNWVPNPAQTLVEILASLKSNGRVEIEGFDACATPITTADRAAVAGLPPLGEGLLTELGVAFPERESPLFESVLSSSFNIRGMLAGKVGEQARNVIPATAHASIDMRLATGVDPQTAIDQVVAQLSKLGVTVIDHEPTEQERAAHPRLVRVDEQVGYPGFRVPTTSPVVAFARNVIAETVGAEPVVLPSLGGSVPFHGIHGVLGVDGIIVPIANHDNNQHTANENMKLGNLAYGIELFTSLLTSTPSSEP